MPRTTAEPLLPIELVDLIFHLADDLAWRWVVVRQLSSYHKRKTEQDFERHYLPHLKIRIEEFYPRRLELYPGSTLLRQVDSRIRVRGQTLAVLAAVDPRATPCVPGIAAFTLTHDHARRRHLDLPPLAHSAEGRALEDWYALGRLAAAPQPLALTATLELPAPASAPAFPYDDCDVPITTASTGEPACITLASFEHIAAFFPGDPRPSSKTLGLAWMPLLSMLCGADIAAREMLAALRLEERCAAACPHGDGAAPVEHDPRTGPVFARDDAGAAARFAPLVADVDAHIGQSAWARPALWRREMLRRAAGLALLGALRCRACEPVATQALRALRVGVSAKSEWLRARGTSSTARGTSSTALGIGEWMWRRMAS